MDDKFDKRHPRHRCPRCGGPNYLPNESMPANAGARLGVNVTIEASHPSFWKANGGSGTVTVRSRLCEGCSGVLTRLLVAGRFFGGPPEQASE